jgi:hypothetical protein
MNKFKIVISPDKLQTSIYKKLVTKSKDFLANHKNQSLSSQVKILLIYKESKKSLKLIILIQGI